MRKYRINDVFKALQGEGIRAGTVNVFVRFTGCNLKCDVEEGPLSPGGFACDTEFASGRSMTSQDLIDWIVKVNGNKKGCSLILTGGEPALQADSELIDDLHAAGYLIAIETNGSVEVDEKIDWITISPKVAEHAIKQTTCDEIKYVRAYGQGIPKPTAVADYYLISPAFDADRENLDNLEWCKKLVKENPRWRLSVQMHKLWNER